MIHFIDDFISTADVENQIVSYIYNHLTMQDVDSMHDSASVEARELRLTSDDLKTLCINLNKEQSSVIENDPGYWFIEPEAQEFLDKFQSVATSHTSYDLNYMNDVAELIGESSSLINYMKIMGYLSIDVTPYTKDGFHGLNHEFNEENYYRNYPF